MYRAKVGAGMLPAPVLYGEGVAPRAGCVDFVLRPNEIARALTPISTRAVLSAIRAGNRIASAAYPDSVETTAPFARS